MAIIEAELNRIPWPEQCCRCGGHEYSIQKHSDDVILWTIVGVTASRKITLPIPVCKRCALSSYVWYGLAALMGLGAYLILDSHGSLGVAVMLIFGAIAAGITGTRKRPIRILSYDEKSDRVKIQLFNDDIAREMELNLPPKSAEERAADTARLRAARRWMQAFGISVLAAIVGVFVPQDIRMMLIMPMIPIGMWGGYKTADVLGYLSFGKMLLTFGMMFLPFNLLTGGFLWWKLQQRVRAEGGM